MLAIFLRWFPTHLSPHIVLGKGMIVLVFGVFLVCCKGAAFTVSHNVESGDQGENQRNRVFLFHTQRRVTYVTFICLPVLLLFVYVVMFPSSVFLIFAEVMKTQHDFKTTT